TWSEGKFVYEGIRAQLPLRDRDGEYHMFPMVLRDESGEGRRDIAVNYFIDIWHVRTTKGGTQWETGKRIFEGYVGSINCVMQLSTGRIIVPFAEWIGGRKQGPPTGANVVTCVYSDDGGATWLRSEAALTAPRPTDYNGSGYGACEPVLIELKDGRVYMLARTETGRLYESYSPNGIDWEPLRPSRFLGTDAPANLLRLPDGRILLFWNGCEKPPRLNGDGVYGGRDLVHAAISDDECKTWRGFREIYRDPTRNETPPRKGDRGTAYPMPYLAPQDKVIVMTGQGRAGGTLLFDPDWLLETESASDFSLGLNDWSVFKPFGPAERWWRDRVQGAHLVAHPEKEGAQVLHLRRPDEKDGDGAVWNFPLGVQGEVTLKVLLQEGFGGATISLLDRFFDPTDARAAIEAPFSLTIAPDGRIALRHPLLTLNTWHNLTFHWDLPARTCVVSVDGEERVWLNQAYREPLGINYVHIRTTSEEISEMGMLIESVSARIEP
ncbi:MAG: glycoside hydrolase, partial [Candidatus Hydrogenedentes bacterium]|nr:glycoside hydrolase [Candidatus Hydrogenedentota bacterium]